MHLWKYLLYSPRYKHMCRPYFFRKWHISSFFTEKVTFKRDFQYKPRIFVLKLFDLNSAFQNGCMFEFMCNTSRDMPICAGQSAALAGTIMSKFISLVLFKPRRSMSAFWNGLDESFQMKSSPTKFRGFRKPAESVF